MVGARGFEPPASRSRTVRSTKLSYAPRLRLFARRTGRRSARAGTPPAGATPPKAVVAPHAGYIYSGPIAASAFSALQPARALARVILLGPSHHVLLRGLALPGVEALATPLGEVEVDADGAAALQSLPQVTVPAAAHGRAHSLGVERPSLQVFCPRRPV